MIFSLILIKYLGLVLILIYVLKFLKKLKERPNLGTFDNSIFHNLIYLFFLFIFFVIFFRFLNLFRQRSPIDVYQIFNKLLEYDLLIVCLCAIIFFLIIKILIYSFKLNFLIIHYYLLNPIKFSFSAKYEAFIYFFVTWPNRFILFFLFKKINFFQVNRNFFYFFLKYFFILIMFILFFIDLYFHGFILVYFTAVLPWYSLYQLFYSMNSFLYYDIEYLYDIVITNVLYPNKNTVCYNTRLYYESKDDSVSTDEFFLIRNYITKKLLK